VQIDFILTADMANIDAAGKFNIIGEFNAVGAQTLPSRPINMVIVARIVAAASESDTHDLEIALVDQDGKELARVPAQQIKFARSVPGSSADLRAQIVVGVQGLQFHSYGAFSFHVLIDGRFLGGPPIYELQPPKK